jgi:hypothetical protein
MWGVSYKTFPVTLTFDLVTTKIIGVYGMASTTCTPSIKHSRFKITQIIGSHKLWNYVIKLLIM